MDERDRALDAAHRAATAFLATLADRPVWPRATLDEMIGSAWEWRRRNLDPATGARLPA